MYEHAPDGVLFTAPDGRVLAANPAACQILGRTEAEICSLGRRSLADHTDERWGTMLAERERTGHAQGVARMVRGDGSLIEVEMSARIFREASGQQRTCTILRDATERLRLERELADKSARLRELTLTDELTGLRNRRGFLEVGAQMLELADRERSTALLLFLDIDHMKQLNDRHGHTAGDAALRAVARALNEVLRRADTLSRIGGDEFVALALRLNESDGEAIKQRIQHRLSAASTVPAGGQGIEVSMGWATRTPSEPKTLEDLLAEADHDMYRAKAIKDKERSRLEPVTDRVSRASHRQ